MPGSSASLVSHKQRANSNSPTVVILLFPFSISSLSAIFLHCFCFFLFLCYLLYSHYLSLACSFPLSPLCLSFVSRTNTSMFMALFRITLYVHEFLACRLLPCYVTRTSNCHETTPLSQTRLNRLAMFVGFSEITGSSLKLGRLTDWLNQVTNQSLSL